MWYDCQNQSKQKYTVSTHIQYSVSRLFYQKYSIQQKSTHAHQTTTKGWMGWGMGYGIWGYGMVEQPIINIIDTVWHVNQQMIWLAINNLPTTNNSSNWNTKTIQYHSVWIDMDIGMTLDTTSITKIIQYANANTITKIIIIEWNRANE